MQNLDCQGFSTALLQSQKDFCNETTAQQKCGWGKDRLWPRAGGIMQVTQKDGNLPLAELLTPQCPKAQHSRAAAPLFLELILHPSTELDSLLSR